ncbi:MAG: hypothetical protein DSY38_01755, partial [Fusobacteria bacterium]
AEKLPNFFELDVSDLDVGDNILIRDINFPEGVECYINGNEAGINEDAGSSRRKTFSISPPSGSGVLSCQVGQESYDLLY